MHKSDIHNCIASRLFQSLVGVTFLLFFIPSSYAQHADTTITKSIVSNDTIKKDSVKPAKPQKYHSPKKAAMYSMILPGSGQVYNKKYWKVPFIYAAAAGLTYSLQWNQSHYIKYRNAYRDRLNGVLDPTYVLYSDNDLNNDFTYFRRYRDLTVIGFAALYILNVIDASVDAHLFHFDVSDDLSFNIQPTLINTVNVNHYSTGLSLSLKF